VSSGTWTRVPRDQVSMQLSRLLGRSSVQILSPCPDSNIGADVVRHPARIRMR
jgi:hypothetical protein